MLVIDNFEVLAVEIRCKGKGTADRTDGFLPQTRAKGKCTCILKLLSENDVTEYAHAFLYSWHNLMTCRTDNTRECFRKYVSCYALGTIHAN